MDSSTQPTTAVPPRPASREAKSSLFARCAPSLWQEAQAHLRFHPSEPPLTRDEVDPAQLELVIEEMRKAADGQWEAWKQADGRIQFLLGLAVSMITIGIATGLAHSFANPSARVLVGAALTSIALASLFLLAAYRSDRFVHPGSRLRLAHLAVSSSPQAACEAVVLRLARAHAANDRALRLKLRRSRRGFLLLVFGGLGGLAVAVRRSSGSE